MSALEGSLSEQGQTADRRRAVVAGLCGVGGAAAASAQTSGTDAVVAGFCAAVVVVLAAIDLRERIIPNRIVLPATAVVLLMRIAFSSHPGTFVMASAAAGLAMLVLNLGTRSGIGMGDVKFALLIGATLGSAALGAIVLGFLSIFPVAVIVLIRGGRAARTSWLPLGPFLALGTLVMLLAGAGAG